MNFLNEGASADCSRREKNGSNLGEVRPSLHSSPCSLYGLVPTAFVPAKLLLWILRYEILLCGAVYNLYAALWKDEVSFLFNVEKNER